jgi:hypothetical protein
MSRTTARTRRDRLNRGCPPYAALVQRYSYPRKSIAVRTDRQCPIENRVSVLGGV